jgi:hypothetical protein
MILPAMADVKNKGGRTQCASNLRQLAMASMIYANDYNTWLTTVKAGSNPVNVLSSQNSTRIMWAGSAMSYSIPKSYSQPFGTFNNLGYLWGGNYVNDGTVFFCPALWGTALGENAYSPTLSSDFGGFARACYQFNPRVDTGASNLRRYQKTSQLRPRNLFGVDYLDVSTSSFAHHRESGWNVLFTDGSVKFSQNNSAYNLIKTVPGGLIGATLGEQIYDLLEQDH